MIRKSALSGLTLAGLFAAGVLSPGIVEHRSALAHTGHVFAAGEPGDPKKPNRVVEVIMHEAPGRMMFVPDRIEVNVGQQVRFVLRNEGELDHEFLLDSVANNQKHAKEMEKNPEMEHNDPNGTRIVTKKTTELLWRFTKAGTFEFACLIPGHYEAGMKGVVVVTEPKRPPVIAGAPQRNGRSKTSRDVQSRELWRDRAFSVH